MTVLNPPRSRKGSQSRNSLSLENENKNYFPRPTLLKDEENFNTCAGQALGSATIPMSLQDGCVAGVSVQNNYINSHSVDKNCDNNNYNTYTNMKPYEPMDTKPNPNIVVKSSVSPQLNLSPQLSLISVPLKVNPLKVKKPSGVSGNTQGPAVIGC